MISSAEEFVRLRSSSVPEEAHRATSESATDSTWAEIIERYPDMRKWVAHNKTISDAIIMLLVDDLNDDVRWAIAQKRKTPSEALRKLARDRDPGVRLQVAQNAKTPNDVLEDLAKDGWNRVAEVAQSRLGHD